jgi:hypothetical protein
MTNRPFMHYTAFGILATTTQMTAVIGVTEEYFIIECSFTYSTRQTQNLNVLRPSRKVL